MKGIKIISTGHALPKKCLSNEALSQFVDTNDEWITTRTGIKTRYQCEEETCDELAISAAKQAVEQAGIDKNRIGAVICATSTPDHIFPSVACLVQQALELPEDVAAFDIAAACTGFLYSMQIAHGFVNTMENSIEKPYILAIGCERLSRILDYTDRTTCILFGDGAGAAVIEATDTPYYQKSYSRGNLEVLNCKGVGYEDGHLHMKGNDVFKFAVKALEQGICDVVEKSDTSLDQLDLILCHQANARIIDHVKKKYPQYADKFFMNIEKYGNTSAASIPIALDEWRKGILEQGLAQAGESKRVLCVGFGAGLTWSASIVEVVI